MSTQYYHIYTIGCQMNVYDSDQMARRLELSGFQPTNDLAQADIIITNTCTIRAKAEQKAFSFLGRLAKLKRGRPGLIVAIGGCVAQQQGRAILERMPHVDLVFGTQAISRLPEMVASIQRQHCRIVDVETSDSVRPGDFIVGGPTAAAVSAFVTIMRGCDNYCTYCVVPYVRGREVSRPPDDIINEIQQLVDMGVREVTLLGQNVNSYGQREKLVGFCELLEQVHAVNGIERIRFTTSHPKDLSDELMDAFSRLDKLCPHIHLPVQAGSDAVLRRMNRKYTRARYLDKVDRLRRSCPGIAITTDIIVGFPAENEADFQQTLDLIEQVQFDGLFAFIYSDRPHAPAARYAQKVDEAIKKSRLQAVLALQETLTLAKHQALVGSIQSVLVEGPSKLGNVPADAAPASTPVALSGRLQWSGRTGTNKIVNFILNGNRAQPHGMPKIDLTGQTIGVIIEKALAHSMWGRAASGTPVISDR